MNKKSEPALIVRGVDKKLRNQFKSACALAGVSMTQAIQTWMREVINDESVLRDKKSEESKN